MNSSQYEWNSFSKYTGLILLAGAVTFLIAAFATNLSSLWVGLFNIFVGGVVFLNGLNDTPSVFASKKCFYEKVGFVFLALAALSLGTYNILKFTGLDYKLYLTISMASTLALSIVFLLVALVTALKNSKVSEAA